MLSFSAQDLNTFNIISVNLQNKGIEVWYETHALFETKLTGFMLADGDFLILDRFGMHIVCLKK